MDMHEFWSVIETARSTATADKTFTQALADELASRTKSDILSYQERFDEVQGAVYRWDVWAAAYLIGGGCSDDSFMDFRAGLIALGRDWYEKAAACPDRLAEHPAVIEAACAQRDDAIFDEATNYTASYAFERLTGDDHAFYEAWDAYTASREEHGRTMTTWEKTSTSTIPQRCGAVSHDSPPSTYAAPLTEQGPQDHRKPRRATEYARMSGVPGRPLPSAPL